MGAEISGTTIRSVREKGFEPSVVSGVLTRDAEVDLKRDLMAVTGVEVWEVEPPRDTLDDCGHRLRVH